MNSLSQLTKTVSTFTIACPLKTDLQILQFTLDLSTSLKCLHDQNFVHGDICLNSVVKINDKYVLTKSEKKAGCSHGIASSSNDTIALELANDIYELGRVFFQYVFPKNIPYPSSKELSENKVKNEYCTSTASDAKKMMETPHLVNDTLRFVTLWMLHPDPKERPTSTVVYEKLHQLFPSHLPAFSCLAPSSKQKIVLDLANIEACAFMALGVLINNGLQNGYGYLSRKNTGTDFQILGSLEKNWVLLLPENKEGRGKGFNVRDVDSDPKEPENGTYKVGRRAIVLEKIGDLWERKCYFALSSRNERDPLYFKGSYAKEMWLYEKLGASNLFPRHIMSFTYANKPHKRLALYEAYVGCLFDQNVQAFSICSAYSLAAKLLELHQMGFAHRDIKNENVLVAEDGSFVFCDIDTVVPDELWKNRISVVGTEDIIAPERYTNHTGSWFPDDVYGLGCLFYEKFFDQDLPWVDLPPVKKREYKNKYLVKATEAKNFVESNFSCLTRESADKLANCLVYWMIHPSPTERPSMQKVCEVLENLVEYKNLATGQSFM